MGTKRAPVTNERPPVVPIPSNVQKSPPDLWSGSPRKDVMSWLEWIILVAAIVGIFVLWDLVFCGGEHCKQLIGRE